MGERSELDEALAAFLGPDLDSTATPLGGGFRNAVYGIATPSKAELVLRIYRNGGVEQKVAFEHAVIQAATLAASASSSSLPFQVPEAIPSRYGCSWVRLSTGNHACLFKKLPGEGAPQTSEGAFAIGGAAAQVMKLLSRLPRTTGLPSEDAELPNPQFRHLWEAHPVFQGSRDEVMAAVDRIAASAFSEGDSGLKDLRFLEQQAVEMEELIATDESGSFSCLPEQIIHADLHGGNILVEKESEEGGVVAVSIRWRVTAVLDWEFATYDWRILDPAIAVSKYLSVSPEAARWELLRSWFDGFIDAGGSLNGGEAKAFPLMLVLRHIIGFIYFLGRVTSGEEPLDVVTSRVSSYAARIRWAQANSEALQAHAGRAVIEKESAFVVWGLLKV
jgi:homoserine kinase type II